MRYLFTITDPTGQRPPVRLNFETAADICKYLAEMKCHLIRPTQIDNDIRAYGLWRLPTAYANYKATREDVLDNFAHVLENYGTRTNEATPGSEEKSHYPNDETRNVILATENDKRSHDLMRTWAKKDSESDFQAKIKRHISGNAGGITWPNDSKNWDKLKNKLDLEFISKHFASIHYPAAAEKTPPAEHQSEKEDRTCLAGGYTLNRVSRGIHVTVGQRYILRNGHALTIVAPFKTSAADNHFFRAVDGSLYLANGLYHRNDYNLLSPYDIVATMQPSTIPEPRITVVTTTQDDADRSIVLYERADYSEASPYDIIATAICTTSTSTQTTKEPTPMKNLALNTKTFLNGIDVNDLSDDALVEHIRAGEAELANVEKIINKPKKLQAKIDKLKTDIAALVEFIDGRPAK